MADRVERLINLVIALRETRRPLTAADIRERVAGYGQQDPEAFRRMFERDKADLRGLGVPLETAPVDLWDDTVGYRIDPRRYDLPEVSLEAEELTALALAVQATGLEQQAATGLLKLEVDAGEPGASRGQAARAALREGLEIDLDAPHRDALLEAQLTRTTVSFRYRAPGRAGERRTVDPHALVHRRGRWYLVGHDHARAGRRAFRLDRVVDPPRPVAGRPFPPPNDQVGPDDVVPPVGRGEPVRAEVTAAPAVAWQVARRARGGGSADPDGWTRFSVAVGDPDRFVSWVLSYGPELELLGPPELRARVVAELRRTLDLTVREGRGA